jgi:hypothetical protein
VAEGVAVRRTDVRFDATDVIDDAVRKEIDGQARRRGRSRRRVRYGNRHRGGLWVRGRDDRSVVAITRIGQERRERKARNMACP